MGIAFPKGDAPDAPGVFSHSEETDTGGGKERVGQASVIVSLDGSGDTDSIQAAVDLLPQIGGTVFIKAGTYNLKEVIFLENLTNIQIIGEGRAAIITTTETFTHLFRIRDCTNILISGLQLKGNPSGVNNNGIVIDGTNQAIIQDCFITTCGRNGIETAGGNLQLHIINNEIFECEENGMTIQSDFDVIITGNRLRANKHHGIEIRSSNGLVISNNHFRFNGTDTEGWDGLSLGNGDKNTITANIFLLNRNYGLEFDATSNENVFISNVFDANVTGRVLDNGGNNLPNGATGTNNLEIDDLNILS